MYSDSFPDRISFIRCTALLVYIHIYINVTVKYMLYLLYLMYRRTISIGGGKLFFIRSDDEGVETFAALVDKNRLHAILCNIL